MENRINIDTEIKVIEIITDESFIDFTIGKYKDYYHCNFKKSEKESFGFALFFKDFGGRKYYPNRIDNIETFRAENKVLISYSIITQPDWQSVAEKLAEALNEARNFTIWCEDIIETDDDELVEMYNQMEVSFLNNSHSALNEYKKLKDERNATMSGYVV